MRAPLAERIRPQSLSGIVGQEHLIAKESILYKAIELGKIPSMIFWGPPGTGKTTLAQIIAKSVNRDFYQLSAISSGVKEIREVINNAANKNGVILFIDEIHRFNKSQQDALLGAIEQGIITLIGATTENPSFEINAALLSRCQVYVLKHLEENGLLQLIQKAIENDEVLKHRKIILKEHEALIQIAGGDARKTLNLLELVCSLPDDEIIITDKLVMETAQNKIALYDKDGEQHFDIISAFIKSVRGSDPNAAVYWLTRMIAGGEDVKFIARRMMILAAEDIGNANPTALVLANTTFDAVAKIGFPEASLILSQCAIYLAASPKSNSATTALGLAQAAVSKYGSLPVPIHLRNAATKLMSKLGYGEGYKYSHDFENNFAMQEYLPENISGTKFYTPGSNAREEELRKFLQKRWHEKYKY